MLLFQPDAAEVHRKAGTWFADAEIYGWFAANLHRVREPSLRHYVRTGEFKAAGMDWTEVLAAEEENKRERLAAELLSSPVHGSTAERVRAFVERGGAAGRRSSIIGANSVVAAGTERAKGTHPERLKGTHLGLQDSRSGQRRQVCFTPTFDSSWPSLTRETGSSLRSSRRCGNGGSADPPAPRSSAPPGRSDSIR